MPVVSMSKILKPAFEQRYGVGAFNIFNELTMEAVLAAAAEAKSPVIIQVSVKTVKRMGAKLLQVMFKEMANQVPIPATLHLDHCQDLKIIEECLAAGWNSVLFDGSNLSYEENMEQTMKVVALARKYGANVEGELEAILGVEDGVGSEYGGEAVALDKIIEFIRRTNIDSFAPSIGTAHGVYKSEPKIDFERITQIVAACPIPLVIHGGTGLHDSTFKELIHRGCCKINISTQLKIVFADSLRTYLNEKPNEYDPLKLLDYVRKNVIETVKKFIYIFGSEGKAA